MDVNRFLKLAAEQEWILNDVDYNHCLTPDGTLPVIDSKQISLIRVNCIIWVLISEIKELDENNFMAYLNKHTDCYHFLNDWKRAFSGSEFLIPVIEKELLYRELNLKERFLSRLCGIKNDVIDIHTTVEYLEIEVTELVEKYKALKNE